MSALEVDFIYGAKAGLLGALWGRRHLLPTRLSKVLFLKESTCLRGFRSGCQDVRFYCGLSRSGAIQDIVSVFKDLT